MRVTLVRLMLQTLDVLELAEGVLQFTLGISYLRVKVFALLQKRSSLDHGLRT